MRKTTKIWLAIATSFTFFGIVLFASVMTVLKWDFTKLSTVKYQTNSYEINESFENITILSDTADIVFAGSETAKTTVVCYEEEKVEHTVSVKDGALVVELVDRKEWHERIGINFGSSKITIYLPQKEYGEVCVKTSTGDLKIVNGFQFESIDVQQSTGDIELKNVSAGAISLSVSTGETRLIDTSCKNLISNGGTGDILLRSVIATEKISIKRTTGDVEFDRSDASEIVVETSTGDIEGTLLSGKVFIPDSNTGDIELPQTQTGGRCELTTDTGDIEIKIYNG